MIQVFISYAIEDKITADIIHDALLQKEIKSFLAERSITLGTKWPDKILGEMKKSKWVFFLASKASCSSQFVQQELGAAMYQKKEIVPILIDIERDELPGWAREYEAIDYNKSSDLLWNLIDNIKKIEKESSISSNDILSAGAILAVGGLLAGAGALFLKSKGKKDNSDSEDQEIDYS